MAWKNEPENETRQVGKDQEEMAKMGNISAIPLTVTGASLFDWSFRGVVEV